MVDADIFQRQNEGLFLQYFLRNLSALVLNIDIQRICSLIRQNFQNQLSRRLTFRKNIPLFDPSPVQLPFSRTAPLSRADIAIHNRGFMAVNSKIHQKHFAQ